jgi:hypothetical protein
MLFYLRTFSHIFSSKKLALANIIDVAREPVFHPPVSEAITATLVLKTAKSPGSVELGYKPN